MGKVFYRHVDPKSGEVKKQEEFPIGGVRYMVGIYRLKLFLTTAVLKEKTFQRMKKTLTRRVTGYVDDKINFWITKIDKDNKKIGTSLIELILLPASIASLKEVQHKIYDIARVSKCLARIITETGNAYDQMIQLQKNKYFSMTEEEKKDVRRKSLRAEKAAKKAAKKKSNLA